MLKLFLLEREEISENIKITLLIAAKGEKSAREIASENALIHYHKNFWLRPKKEKIMLLSSIALRKTYGASCKKIGIASKGIAQGILLTLKQQIAPDKIKPPF